MYTVLCIWTVLPLQSTIFYVDPTTGDMSNDGSYEQPWRTLEEVIEGNLLRTQSYLPLPYNESSVLVPKNDDAPVQPGDTIMLRTGYHGSVFYRGAYMKDYLTIMAEPGHQPVIGNVHLRAARRFIFDGVIFSPEGDETFYYATLFLLESHSHHGPAGHVILRNCTLYGTYDSSDWGIEEWNDVGDCIVIKGDSSLIENNVCKNVREGINLFGPYNQAISNQFINFSRDGMRGQGNHLLFEGNVIKNSYNVNDNHDDAFQSFSTGDTIRDVTLRGNTVINFEDPDQPFKGALQGFGCFDGPYADWVIENNLIVTNHFHGITIQGAHRCTIQNNTIIDIDLANVPNGTWLRVADSKDGATGSNNLVQNNISMGLQLNESVTSYHNEIVDDYEDFMDVTGLDLRLTTSSPLGGAGRLEGAPSKDLLQRERLNDGLIDLGAIESPGLIECSQEDILVLKNMGNQSYQYIDGSFKVLGPTLVMPLSYNHIHITESFDVMSSFEILNNTELQLVLTGCDD